MQERLWAPWRLEYVEKPTTGTKSAGNFFLELPQLENDRENLILHRGKEAFVMLNAYPYTNGHLLVAPFRQVAELEGLTDRELLEINQLLARAVVWLKATYKPNGFNVGANLGVAAGAGVPVHIHWHVVPRWSGDTNFMATVGDVRVLPESLGASYDRLRKVIESEP
jgi:ATP adenylyltransferase